MTTLLADTSKLGFKFKAEWFQPKMSSTNTYSSVPRFSAKEAVDVQCIKTDKSIYQKGTAVTFLNA